MNVAEKPLIKDTKAILLQVSEELFANHGFEGTSTRMITEAAGVNVAMITYYFGSKKALYFAIFKKRLLNSINEIERVGTLKLGPAEKMELYLRGYIQRIQSNQGFYRMESRQLTMLEQPSIVALLNDSRNKAFLLLHTIITKGIVENVFKRVDIEVSVLNILYLLPTLFTRPDTLFGQLGFAVAANAHHNSLENRIVNYFLSSLIS
jgi:AcrR family transcriptional regulator